MNSNNSLPDENESEAPLPTRNIVNASLGKTKSFIEVLSPNSSIGTVVCAPSSTLTNPKSLTSNNYNYASTQYLANNSQPGETNQAICSTPLLNQATMLYNSALVTKQQLSNTQLLFENLSVNKRGKIQLQESFQHQRTALTTSEVSANPNGTACMKSDDSFLHWLLRLRSHRSAHHQPILNLPIMPPLLPFSSSRDQIQPNSGHHQQQHMNYLQIHHQNLLSQEHKHGDFEHSAKPKGRPSVFPKLLHQMLCDLEKQPGGTEIASFLPNGCGFAIHKPKQFMEHVIPNYFHLTSITSLRRQLKLYNFQLISTGRDKGAYYHELFIRGQPLLCCSIKRSDKNK